MQDIMTQITLQYHSIYTSYFSRNAIFQLRCNEQTALTDEASSKINNGHKQTTDGRKTLKLEQSLTNH